MFKIFLLSIILIFYCYELKSQKLLVILANELPPELSLNTEQSQILEMKLNQYNSINPELVAYYLIHLKRKYHEFITSPDSNGFNLLFSMKESFIKSQNVWIENELALIKEIEKSSFVKNEVKKQLFLLKAEVKNNIPYFNNSNSEVINYSKFIAYKILSENSDLIYEKKIVYASFLSNWFENYYDSLTEKISRVSVNSNGSEILPQILKARYYFIEKNSDNSDGRSFVFLLSTFFKNTVTSDDQSFTYKYFIQVNNEILNEEMTYSFKNKFIGNSPEKKNAKLNASFKLLGIGFGYKIKLSGLNVPFSFFNISGNYFILTSTSFPSDAENGLYFSQRFANPDPFTNELGYKSIEYDYTTKENPIEIEKSYWFAIKTSTPVYYLNNNVYFSVSSSFILSKRSIKTEIKSNFTNYYWASDTFRIPKSSGTFPSYFDTINTDLSFSIKPELSVDYTFNNYINFALSVGFMKSITYQLSASYLLF